MFQLLAVCPMGLEAVVAKEIQELGYDTQVENGRIFFEGDESAIVRCNLWLRTADRIKIVMGRFNATTFDELFEEKFLLSCGLDVATRNLNSSSSFFNL